MLKFQHIRRLLSWIRHSKGGAIAAKEFKKMRLKYVFLVVLFLSAMIISYKTTSVTNPQTSHTIFSTEGVSLSKHVQDAKEKGKKKVVFPAPIGIPSQVESLSQAIDTYPVLVVQLVAQKSYAQGEDDIITWHKFKIIENLSKNKAFYSSNMNLQEALPEETFYQELKEDEFLIPQSGGSLNVDGITLIQESSKFPLLSLNQKYLLFPSKNPSEKIGRMELGPYGVFTVNPDESLSPLVKQETPIGKDIKQYQGNSLSRLKTSLSELNSR
jgi:hypothetical protein